MPSYPSMFSSRPLRPFLSFVKDLFFFWERVEVAFWSAPFPYIYFLLYFFQRSLKITDGMNIDWNILLMHRRICSRTAQVYGIGHAHKYRSASTCAWHVHTHTLPWSQIHRVLYHWLLRQVFIAHHPLKSNNWRGCQSKQLKARSHKTQTQSTIKVDTNCFHTSFDPYGQQYGIVCSSVLCCRKFKQIGHANYQTTFCDGYYGESSIDLYHFLLFHRHWPLLKATSQHEGNLYGPVSWNSI